MKTNLILFILVSFHVCCLGQFVQSGLSKDSMDFYFSNMVAKMKLVASFDKPNKCKAAKEEVIWELSIDSLSLGVSNKIVALKSPIEVYSEYIEGIPREFVFSVYPKHPTIEVNFLYTFCCVQNGMAYVQSYHRKGKKLGRPKYLIFQL